MLPSWMARCPLGVLIAAAVVLSSPGPRSSNHNWKKYVRSPESSIINPVAVISDETLGNVTNHNGMIDGGEATILTRKNAHDTPPTVVVEFGQNVVGILTINFAGSQNEAEGLPGIRLAFSETMECLTNRSDFTRSDNAAGVSATPFMLRMIH